VKLTITNRVWTQAFQFSLDKSGALYIPESDEPYYIDGPIVVSSGQTLIAGKKAEIRLVPKTNTCMVRNNSVTGMDKTTLEIPDIPYDKDIYVEGGIWTALRYKRGLTNGNFSGRTSKTNSFHGAHGVFVFNHADGFRIDSVTVKQSQMHALQLSDAHNFWIENVSFLDHGRDGVHVHGGSDFGVIRNISGVTHDDFIALNAWDWEHTSPVVGGIHHVLVEDCICDFIPGKITPGTFEFRLLPGNRKRSDGSVKSCKIKDIVIRNITNLRTIKMYDQPNLERGRDKDRSQPLGVFENVYIHDLHFDRPGFIEIDDFVNGLDIARLTYSFNPESIKKPIVKVGPKSGTYKSKRDDPSKWVEIFSPECDIEVKNFSLRDIKYIASNGKTVNVAPEKIFRCEDGKLNPDYPKTTPRGGTGKVRIFQGRFE
jgi:hypothetical protein